MIVLLTFAVVLKLTKIYINHTHSEVIFQFLPIIPKFIIFQLGKRPFGVSLLYMGWDKHYGFQLYQSDPSGNYGGWKATCIGNNSAVS